SGESRVNVGSETTESRIEMMLQQKVSVISQAAHADLRNISDEGWNETVVELMHTPVSSCRRRADGAIQAVPEPSNSRPQKEVPRILPAPRAVIAGEAPRGD